ncbi:melanopsin-like [Amphiura filiformis]|uniref:melanopsin-like n=1 Tax=Amphiura filiformis TaxID=82378 RepID=UPI003B20C7DB
MASLPPVFGIGQLGYDKRFSSCTWDPTHPKSRAYSLLLSAVVYPVSLIIISVCYSVIFVKIRSQTRKIGTAAEPAVSVTESSGMDSGRANVRPSGLQQSISRRHVQVTRNMFLVVLLFVACLTPYAASLMLTNSSEFIVYGAQILLANSCVNPIIYGTRHPDFKVIMKYVVRCRLRDVPDKTMLCKKLLRNETS